MPAIKINGEVRVIEIEDDTPLLWVLRDTLGLTGTKFGCGVSACGACTVMLDDQTVRGWLALAVQADGCKVETIEGGKDEDLAQSFHILNALQCGFCTPGMLLSAGELLRANPDPSRKQIRDYLSGNYCRCTGYQAIVDAVAAVAEARNR